MLPARGRCKALCKHLKTRCLLLQPKTRSQPAPARMVAQSCVSSKQMRLGCSHKVRGCELLQAARLPRLPARISSVQVKARFLDLAELEKDRKAHRTVYDFPQWQKHRSPLRLIDRLLSIPASVILKNVVPTVAWVASVSTFLVAYHYCHEQGSLPAGFPDLGPNIACKTFVSNTAIALSLLLVFRTNNGYGRWDEARKMWGLLVNRSRDLARMTTTLFPDSAPEAKAAMIRWIAAYPRIFRMFLQPEYTLDNSDLRDMLTEKEFQLLKRSANPQVKGIHVMSEIIHSTVKDPVQQLQMSQNLTQYHDIIGGCERLLRAPIPVSYTRHTARFLFCWLTLLPFTLDAQPWQIPTVAGIALVLGAIEEIGVQCEEPFGILPLERISDRIKGDVMNTLKDDADVRSVLWDSIGLSEVRAAELAAAGQAEMDGMQDDYGMVTSTNGVHETSNVYN